MRGGGQTSPLFRTNESDDRSPHAFKLIPQTATNLDSVNFGRRPVVQRLV